MPTASPKSSIKADHNISADSPSASDASWLQMLARWNMEITLLYGKRMQEYIMLPLRVMQFTSPDDLAKAQDEFSRTLLSDYRTAAEKLTRAIGANVETGRAAGHEEYAARLLKAQEDAREILDQAKAQAKRIVEEAEKRSAGSQRAGGQTRAA